MPARNMSVYFSNKNMSIKQTRQSQISLGDPYSIFDDLSVGDTAYYRQIAFLS